MGFRRCELGKARSAEASSPRKGVESGRVAARPPARTPETPSSRCQGERFARAESAHRSTAGRPRRAVAGGEGTISCAGSNRVRERDLDVLSRITRGRRTIAFAGVSQGVSGTGLGIAIVWTIARAHDGEVLFEDRPDGGLRVVVRFPWRNQEPQTQKT